MSQEILPGNPVEVHPPPLRPFQVSCPHCHRRFQLPFDPVHSAVFDHFAELRDVLCAIQERLEGALP